MILFNWRTRKPPTHCVVVEGLGLKAARLRIPLRLNLMLFGLFLVFYQVPAWLRVQHDNSSDASANGLRQLATLPRPETWDASLPVGSSPRSANYQLIDFAFAGSICYDDGKDFP